jgi:hypothetical protein
VKIGSIRTYRKTCIYAIMILLISILTECYIKPTFDFSNQQWGITNVKLSMALHHLMLWNELPNLVTGRKGVSDFSIRNIAREFNINYSILSKFITEQTRQEHEVNSDTPRKVTCGYAKPWQIFTVRFSDIIYGRLQICVQQRLISEFLHYGLRSEWLAPPSFRTSSKDTKIFLWGRPIQWVWQEWQVLIKKEWNNFMVKFPKYLADILSVQAQSAKWTARE